MENKMKNYLPKIELDKMEQLLRIEEEYETGKLSLKEARKELAEKVGSIRPYHIAYIEQNMMEADDDECVRVDMRKTLQLLDGIMDYSRPQLPADHPIMHYYRENDEMRKLLLAVEDLVQYPMIKNQWLELYDKINRYPIHYKRKQNQLYPMLERKGFTRPTTTMWNFDDIVRDEIRAAERLLAEDKEEDFIAKQQTLIDYARDLMEKEEAILYPTSLALISEEEFEDMKHGDQEIGFAFFNVKHSAPAAKPQPASMTGAGFASDLQALLSKYGYSAGGSDKLDVTTGKLTLEQINLIYQHLPIDISFVDENELVCFYSDTDHRIFPRSKNVIGREVMNCHPRKSAHVVREVIDKLRNGEQERAEFWINKPDLFIYIVYVAVRDKQGKFRGVLEMMQDCTHIRSLEGSQTLLTWAGEQPEEPSAAEEQSEDDGETVSEITPKTRLKDLLRQYPNLKKRLPEIAPEFKMLNSPLGKIMAARADIQMMSDRSDIPLQHLIGEIDKLCKEEKQ
ncbi:MULTISPECIES: DUF438 domain-containing protein [Prevotellaceae]|uniref:DUF438 domain-containing protein n=1 Tax=Prevotellaceae TaxID=171552 RepID=UPI0003D39260|nr:DUF438 domain-containing protein [Prevotella phocaeensis]ETD21694.1 hypothetical protein HMPREF1199_00024 [Hoylesella oralis CC98A]